MAEQIPNFFRNTTVKDLTVNKRRLVEVPYNASLAGTLNVLLANGVLAAPVAAPPGQWIGAGGSMILESDKVTGAVRKQYIGMISMLDIMVHIAEHEVGSDLEKMMAVPVSNIIGHSLEGLSLWTINPSTSILDCLEPLSKGIHRALVPLDSYMDHVTGIELTESSPGYRMLTQLDVLNFLEDHGTELKGILPQTIRDLGAVNENIFAVPRHTKVIEAIKCMRSASLSAVPVIEASETSGSDFKLINGKGKRPIGTFSATDLRGCPLSHLQPWLSLDVLKFTEMASMSTSAVSATELGDPLTPQPPRPLLTCFPETSLGEVINMVLDHHVHRVWVVDEQGLLVGLVSLTDMLRVIRAPLFEQC